MWDCISARRQRRWAANTSHLRDLFCSKAFLLHRGMSAAPDMFNLHLGLDGLCPDWQGLRDNLQPGGEHHVDLNCTYVYVGPVKECLWKRYISPQALVPTTAVHTHNGDGACCCRAGSGSMCTSTGAHVHLGSSEAALCRPFKLSLQPLHPAQDSILQDGHCVSLIA